MEAIRSVVLLLILMVFMFQQGAAICTGFYSVGNSIRNTTRSDQYCASRIRCNISGAQIIVQWYNPKFVGYLSHFNAYILCKRSKKHYTVTTNIQKVSRYKVSRLCTLTDDEILLRITAFQRSRLWRSYSTSTVCTRKFHETTTSTTTVTHTPNSTQVPQGRDKLSKSIKIKLENFSVDRPYHDLSNKIKGNGKKRYLLIMIYVLGGGSVCLIVFVIVLLVQNKCRRSEERD